MKLKKSLKPKGTKPVVAKPNKTEKKKENDTKLKDAEKVMDSFVKGSVPIVKKQNKNQKNGNGNNKPANTTNKKENGKEKVSKNGQSEENKAAPSSKNNNNKKQLKKILTQDGLLVKHQEGTKWYSYQVNEVVDDTEAKLSSTEINNLLNEGKDILAQDSALLQTRDKQENGSEASWLYSVIAKGTAADKRTAMQLQMHKSPIHSLEYIEKFISSAKKQGTRDIIDIIPILEEAFVNHCLPENRKLVAFNKRKLTKLNELSSGNERTRRKILLLWAYEHEVKILYQQFIETLVEIVKRPLEDLNKRALRVLANCLSSRPESENLILSALVNSFGHPNYKVGSHVVYLLEDIIRKHPAMRMVIAEEIERLIFRKHVNERAHLYSLTFLSQLKFSSKDSDLACKLMKIYLSLFKTIVGKKVTDSRLLPIVLAGANRAFPYAKDAEKLVEDVKDIYFLAHNSNYRTAIPALKLLFQFHKMNEYVSDRYYNALYRKLLENCPSGAYAQLLKLMFDTLKEDPSAQRVRSFVKRLLQVAVNVSSEFAASILLLISKLKSLRKDEQLVVLSKNADPTLRIASKTNEEDDDEERYVDLDAEGNEIKMEIVKDEVKKESDVEITDDKKKLQRGKLGASSTGGWVHRSIQSKGAKSPYDPIARNPLFVDASQVADSELLILSNHFHPSVAVFAKCLMEGGEINYGGDSLKDFALMSFLDRFAFRNPKEVGKGGNRVVRKKEHDPWGVRKLAVNSNDYMKKKRDEIPADERFLHRYTSSLLSDKKVKKEENNEDDWEYADSVNSEEFDAILERFEPGELNEEFDIDYSKEFSAEKNKKNKKSAAEDDVDADEDDLDLNDLDDEDEDEGDDDDDEGGDDNEDDDEDDEDDAEDDDDDDEEGGQGTGNDSRNLFGDDDISSDEELNENDYELAGDQFAEMLEELEEEEEGKNKKKNKKKGVKRPAKRGSFKSAKKPRRH